jgi:hypothetical protein
MVVRGDLYSTAGRRLRHLLLHATTTGRKRWVSKSALTPRSSLLRRPPGMDGVAYRLPVAS